MNEPTFNLNIERGILSAIFFDPSAAGDIIDALDSSDFYTPAHQKIFEASNALYTSGSPIHEDFIIKKHPELAQVVLDILGAGPLPEESFRQELKELAQKRRLLLLATAITAQVNEGEQPANVESAIRAALDDSATVANTSKTYTGHEVIGMEFRELPKYETGIKRVDQELDGGVEHGQLIYVTGDREAGKTHVCYTIMEYMAHRYKAGIISLEFPARKYKARAQQLRIGSGQLSNLYLNFDAESVTSLERVIRKWHKDGVQFITIDSMAAITNGAKERENEALTDTGKRLFRLCKTLDVTIFLIGQNSKDDHKTKSPSAYGAQMLNHFSDQMWHLFRDMDTQERTLWIHKNKQNYEYPKIPMWFKKSGEIVNYNPAAIVHETQYSMEPIRGLE